MIWPLGWFRSVLLDRSDKELVALDRRIRRSLSKGHPNEWTPPGEADRLMGEEQKVLVSIYKSLFLSSAGRVQDALEELRRVVDESGNDQIRGRAMQFLALMLYPQSVTARAEGRLQDAELADVECRDVCLRGLRDLQGKKWSTALTHSFHEALGVLDYHRSDKNSARIHLINAREEYGTVSVSYDRKNPNVYVVDYYLGILASESHDHQRASEYHSRAVKGLPLELRANALARLVSALLKSGKVRKARRVAIRAVKVLSRRGSPKGMIELKGYIAEADARLGRIGEATREIREILQSGIDTEWRNKAQEWLERLEKRK